MENNKVRRLNNGFKILAWMYMFCALLALVVIGHTVNTGEVTVSNHIWSNVTIVVDSLLLAFLSSKAKAIEKEENIERKQ